MKPAFNYSYLLLMTLAAALGGFLFGYDTAVVSGAIGFLQVHFQMNAGMTGWLASSLVAGAIFGAGSSGFIGDRYGRKWSLFGCSVLFIISAVISSLASTTGWFAWSRFAGGLAIGAASMLSPLFIAEIAPKQIRGTLVSLYQLAIVIGIVSVFFVNLQIQRMGNETWNAETGWRWMFASLIFPAAFFGVLLLFASESPRWLMKVGRREEAAHILKKVGGAAYAGNEIAQIEEALKEEEGRWSELFTTGYSRALLIGVLLSIFGQLSGINAIMYFAPEIFKAAGSTTDSAFSQTVTVGMINFIFTLVAVWLVDRAGRKPLLLVGTLVQAISLTSVGLMFHLGIDGTPLLVSIMVFAGAFSIAMGPIPWIINSEIFPTKLRGRAMSLAILALWLADFMVTQTFPMMRVGLGPAITFWIYAFFSLLSAVFILGFIPETKGRTLEEIEHSWLNRKSVS